MMRCHGAKVKSPALQLLHADIEYQGISVAVRDREHAIFNLLRYHEARASIVFCKTRANVNHLFARMTNRGLQAVALSGELSQTERTHALQALRDGRARVCVATDVAARGIDLPGLELVIHADLPGSSETLLHRSGRTGRAGRKGMAVTFVSGRDIYKLQFIERFTKTKIKRGTLPTAGEVEERRIEGLLERIREVLNRGNLSSRVTDRLLEEGFNSTDIASAVIEMLAGPEVAPEKEKPAPSKPTVRSEPDLPMGNIRPPARGMLWVRTNAGRETGITPRDIMSLLEDGLGLPRRSVGLIDILPGESFAQVPKQFLDTLRTGPREIDTNSGPIVVSLVPYNATSKSGADEGKPKFTKKTKRDK